MNLDKTNPEYYEFQKTLESDNIFNDVIHFYDQIDMEEMHEIQEMDKYLPNHIAIADDSGGSFFVLERKVNSPVYKIHMGSLQIDDFEEISPSFKEWKKDGFKLPEVPQYHLPLYAEIYLNNVPEGNLKLLFNLRKFLNISWSISELKEKLPKQPILLDINTPIALEKRLESKRELSDYIYYQDNDKLKKLKF